MMSLRLYEHSLLRDLSFNNYSYTLAPSIINSITVYFCNYYVATVNF